MSMGSSRTLTRRQCRPGPAHALIRVTSWLCLLRRVSPGKSGKLCRRLPSTLRSVKPIIDVPAADWETWVESSDATVIDVREPGEWERGTLPGALLIPQGEIIERIEEIPKDRPVLCVCESGGRSANVATFLAYNDYEAANMSGGMKALGMQG